MRSSACLSLTRFMLGALAFSASLSSAAPLCYSVQEIPSGIQPVMLRESTSGDVLMLTRENGQLLRRNFSTGQTLNVGALLNSSQQVMEGVADMNAQGDLLLRGMVAYSSRLYREGSQTITALTNSFGGSQISALSMNDHGHMVGFGLVVGSNPQVGEFLLNASNGAVSASALNNLVNAPGYNIRMAHKLQNTNIAFADAIGPDGVFRNTLIKQQPHGGFTMTLISDLLGANASVRDLNARGDLVGSASGGAIVVYDGKSGAVSQLPAPTNLPAGAASSYYFSPMEIADNGLLYGNNSAYDLLYSVRDQRYVRLGEIASQRGDTMLPNTWQLVVEQMSKSGDTIAVKAAWSDYRFLLRRSFADFDASGEVAPGDVFEFLNSWFSGDEGADLNYDGVLSVADVFRYLNAFFSGDRTNCNPLPSGPQPLMAAQGAKSTGEISKEEMLAN